MLLNSKGKTCHSKHEKWGESDLTPYEEEREKKIKLSLQLVVYDRPHNYLVIRQATMNIEIF